MNENEITEVRRVDEKIEMKVMIIRRKSRSEK